MQSNAVKFGLSVLVGLIGIQMVMARASTAQIIIGFLVVCVAVIAGTIYLIRLKRSKNSMTGEIDALILANKNKNKK